MLPPRKTPAQEALDALAAIQPADQPGNPVPHAQMYGPFVGALRTAHAGAQTGPSNGADYGAYGGMLPPMSNRVIAAAPLSGAYNGELGGRRYRGRR